MSTLFFDEASVQAVTDPNMRRVRQAFFDAKLTVDDFNERYAQWGQSRDDAVSAISSMRNNARKVLITQERLTDWFAAHILKAMKLDT